MDITEQDLQQTFDALWTEIREARLIAGQPRNAVSARTLSLARHALQLATEAGSEQLLVEAWRMLALTLNGNERYRDAAPYYKKAIEKLEETGQPSLALRMRIGYVMVLANIAEYSEALDVVGAAQSWLNRNPDPHARGRLLQNAGIVHARLGDYARAAETYSKARDIFRSLLDKEGIARTSLNLANVLSNVDEFEQADALYEECRNLSDEAGLTELSAQADYNRAYLHYLRGRYSEALNSFGLLRHRFDRAGSQRHSTLCDLDEAEIYTQLGLSNDAACLAEKAIDKFGQLGMPFEQGRAAAFLGIALMQMHRFNEALEAFREAQTIFETAGNEYWLGLLSLYRAEVYVVFHRLRDAQPLAVEGKAIFDRLAIPSKRVFSLVLLGRIAAGLNDLVTAGACIEEVSVLVATTKAPIVLFPYHVLSGEIAEKAGNWQEAECQYELAVKELEDHQSRLHHDDLRVTFFERRQNAYDALVRLALDRTDTEATSAAYSWCERARSRALVELLSNYAPAIYARAEPSLLGKIHRLREELNVHYVRAKLESRPLYAQPHYETIALKEQELARMLREVSAVDPEYASLQQVSIATLDSVRETLPESTTLIEYFATGEDISVFIVSHTETRVIRRLCPAERVLNLQERLGFQMEKCLLGRDYVDAHAGQVFEAVRQHLQNLYQHLIAPFIQDVQTPHIAIVPHGTLHSLPFHALFDGQQYLIDRFEVSYAPSASILKHCLGKTAAAGTTPLLVGFADEQAPFVDHELSTIQPLFPDSRVLRGRAATRAGFIEASQSASFIHIATHAIFRQDNPMFSSFKLADGYFTAFDLFSLKCPADLVTLSGCQSGVTKVTGSDDLIGLMRGFLYAGTRSLLLSLWNISDESTAALMVNFYKHWQKSASKSGALRQAMRSLRETHPNPFYWAPFMLVGDP